PCDFFVDPLDAGAAGHERVLRPAIRADFRDGHEGAAMVTFEPPAESVLDEPRRAVRAFEFEAALPAHGHRRIAATVQKEQSLLAARQRLSNRLDQRRR